MIVVSMLKRLARRYRTAGGSGRAIGKGQALVELAIILPVLLVLLGGAIDFGRLFYARVAIENSAREGAFFGASRPQCDVPKVGCTNPSNVTWHVQNEAPGLTPLSITIQCFDTGGVVVGVAACQEDHTYRVSVGYQFNLVTPILSSLFGSGIELETSANARVLNEGFTAGPTPTPVPSSTASVTPSPNPGECATPNFIDTRANDADFIWSEAGFTGTLTKIGNGNFIVQGQTLPAGPWVPCVSSITISNSPITPSPSPSSSPTAVPTVSPSPTPSPSPSPTPSCRTVPNLVGLTVDNARTAWTAAGFTGSFTPASGSGNKAVLTQTTNPVSLPSQCIAPTASVTVTHT